MLWFEMWSVSVAGKTKIRLEIKVFCNRALIQGKIRVFILAMPKTNQTIIMLQLNYRFI